MGINTIAKLSLALAVMTFSLSVSTNVFAGHHHHGSNHSYSQNYSHNYGHNYSRQHHGHTRWAKVVKAKPIYEYTSYRVPVESCHIETVRREHRNNTAPVLGAIIGGALGNAVGHNHSNKKVGTVAGAVLGAAVGAEFGKRKRHTTYEDVEYCETNYRKETRREIVGYDVTYRMHGKTYYTTTDEHPGRRIRVAVDVRPVY
ncbi:membrane protein [Marinibactrum halimedae]|uniref:Membrane protein n=2 Tax=Marinibactrum halimedae TaxID=1444977 RepID=A0AA37TAM1_9GAMM|nr:membrane protein [Marinibactrum halimedae]